ncbi:unnamed protein product [Caenorhabditis angaria]|uniref:Uncharacterized protein n=1 Tax=Caenorhabditis angaria TaxID=860376 RepID=A0A9P1MU82_9PELO|nr:unnamed protein product [Caenorhabditis angaria]
MSQNSGNYDHFENNGQRKRSKSRPKVAASSLDNRPPWNNDTYIEGYDDVDDNGKYKNRSGPLPKPKKTVGNQEDLTKNWTESLRDKH